VSATASRCLFSPEMLRLICESRKMFLVGTFDVRENVFGGKMFLAGKCCSTRSASPFGCQLNLSFFEQLGSWKCQKSGRKKDIK
jgi:hypothetical protein